MARIFESRNRFSNRIISLREEWFGKGKPEWFGPLFEKSLAQNIVQAQGVGVPKVYRKFEQIDNLPDFSDLPPRFVLKPTLETNARGVYLIDDSRDIFSGTKSSAEKIRKEIHTDGLINAGGTFIIEEFLQNWDLAAGAPMDYKFYNFGNRTAFVHVVDRRSKQDRHMNRHWFLKPDFSPLRRVIKANQIHSDDPLTPPPFYNEMLSISQKLAEALNMFVRVDLYATTRGPVFGEFTPFPHGGNGFDDETDVWLGRMWRGKFGYSMFDRLQIARKIGAP